MNFIHGYMYFFISTHKDRDELTQVKNLIKSIWTKSEIDSLWLKFKMNWLNLKVETSQSEPKVKTGWSSSKFNWTRGQGESMKVKTSLHRPKLKPIQCMSKVKTIWHRSKVKLILPMSKVKPIQIKNRDKSRKRLRQVVPYYRSS